jgi:xylulokinase
METEAQSIPPGAEGLLIRPFGNGAERMLGNQNQGATITGIDFNRHQRAHLYRAALEGIAFAFVKGTQVLQELGLNLSVLRAGNDNLFQSTIFSETIAQLTGSRIELYPTTGAVGAALAAGVGLGHWPSPEEGMIAEPPAKVILPKPAAPTLIQAFNAWNNLEQP